MGWTGMGHSAMHAQPNTTPSSFLQEARSALVGGIDKRMAKSNASPHTRAQRTYPGRHGTGKAPQRVVVANWPGAQTAGEANSRWQ